MKENNTLKNAPYVILYKKHNSVSSFCRWLRCFKSDLKRFPVNAKDGLLMFRAILSIIV